MYLWENLKHIWFTKKSFKRNIKEMFCKVIDRIVSVFIFTNKKNPLMLAYIWALKKIANGITFDIMKVCTNFMTTILLSEFVRTVTKTKIFFSMKEERNKKKNNKNQRDIPVWIILIAKKHLDKSGFF